eukprot:1656545-Rhodomonas_salina.1
MSTVRVCSRTTSNKGRSRGRQSQGRMMGSDSSERCRSMILLRRCPQSRSPTLPTPPCSRWRGAGRC